MTEFLLDEEQINYVGERLQMVERIPKKQLFVQAFTSKPFSQRVQAGIQRLKQLRAESGFVVMANQRKIVYPPMVLGTANTQVYDVDKVSDSEMHYLGIDGAKVGDPSIVIPENMILSDDPNINTLAVIGDFHFHPCESPFSNQDIECYEKALSDGLVHHKWEYTSDTVWGVFMPQWQYSRGKYLLPLLRLFFFQGPATGNEYQSQNFSSLSLKDQHRVLLDSGFKTVTVNLTVGLKTVDMSPLRTVLEGF